MKRLLCLKLGIDLLFGLMSLFTIARAGEEWCVPNPESLRRGNKPEQVLFSVTPLGTVAADNLHGEAYTVCAIDADADFQKRWKKSPVTFIEQLFQQFQKQQTFELSQRNVTVNGTDAIMYTYPNGGRVLFAYAVSGSEPMLIIENGYGLYLDRAIAIPEATSTPVPIENPTAAPTARPTRGPIVVTTPVPSCSYCGGSKICPICYGQRRYYITGYGVGQGSYINCSGCDGSGRCAYCQ